MADENADGVPPAQATELAKDASNIAIDPSPEERSAKRRKADDAALTPGGTRQDSVPGGGPRGALSGKENATQPGGTNGQDTPKPTNGHIDGRVQGMAPIKKEYLIDVSALTDRQYETMDDDAAEGRTAHGEGASRRDDRDSGRRGQKDKKTKNKGQNVGRDFGRFDDAIRLCNSRAFSPEFSPRECRFGDKCRLSHDLRKYLDEGRRGDVETFEGKCPVFETYGRCPSGWKCRFVKSHMREVEHDDGRKELVLINNAAEKDEAVEGHAESREDEVDEERPGVYNLVDAQVKMDLNRRRVDFSRAEQYVEWLNKESKLNDVLQNHRKEETPESLADIRARYTEPPFKPSEKRRLYFGPETPALAPLTTQGNLPFRRLCVELGAQLTYSEMAMSLPLISGTKSDWALMKAHESELAPPRCSPSADAPPIVADYDHDRDVRFGAQISGNQPWVVTKAAEALGRFCPRLRLIDLNCGCPIDMVFKTGGGSALLENHGKLERMIRGINAMSGEIPVTAKIRTGVKSNRPTAPLVLSRLAFGSREHRERLGAPGCAAITLHGRSREQRYTKSADWGYIAECAALVKSYNAQRDRLADTAGEPDPSTLPNSRDGRIFFLGNGDCYSHTEYEAHVSGAGVDTVMIGRGALVKPWIFEEIERGQYLDKSAGERLGYVERFVRHGLEAWGSDEVGIGFTRRFLLEWLSFAYRYVPIGLLERLPPSLNDRPPAYHGRNDLETLLASPNYKDWIKISEMFLGPVHPTFKFQPKHKSNAYEAEG